MYPETLYPVKSKDNIWLMKYSIKSIDRNEMGAI